MSDRKLTASWCLDIRKTPDDYSTILGQFADELFGTWEGNLPRFLKVEMEPIDLWLEWARDVRPMDYRTDDPTYLEDLGRFIKKNPRRVPPLVRKGREAWDGRHRALAAEQVGVRKLPAIDLNDWLNGQNEKACGSLAPGYLPRRKIDKRSWTEVSLLVWGSRT